MSDAVTTVGWPDPPYKGLSFYTPEDVALFGGRQRQVQNCARMLVRGDTRVLLLYGRSGCGKSSFLRAGLIPHLESRVPVFKFMPEFDIAKTRALFVRCTDQPLLRLAERLYDWGEEPFLVDGEPVDLRAIRGEAQDRGSFIRENGGSVDRMMQVLERIHERFPKWLVLVIDQAEESLTLTKAQPRLRDLFFEFICAFNSSSLNPKLVVAFRSEFFAEFDDQLNKFAVDGNEARALPKRFRLEELSAAELVEAVNIPTSRSIPEPYLQRRCQPAEWYKFTFEEGLPERIVRDLQDIQKDGSVLPILQIACNRLYKIAKRRSGDGDRLFAITEADYRQIGEMKRQVDLYLDETLSLKIRERAQTLDDGASAEELALWRDLLSGFVIEGDAAPLTDAFPEAHLRDLAKELGCKVEFGAMADYLAHENQRILREDRRSLLDQAGGEATVRYYSLGHEIIGPALREWQAKRNVVLERRGFVRNLLQRAAPVVAWTFLAVAAVIAVVGLVANGEVGFWGLVTIAILLLLATGVALQQGRIAASLARNLIDSSMFKELFVQTDDTRQVIRRMRESLNAGETPSPSSQERALLRGADEALQAKPEKDYTFDDWVGRAFAAYAEDKLDLSAEYFNRAGRSPGATLAQQAELTFLRGAILTEMHRPEQAVALYDELISRHLNSADLALRLPAVKALVNKALTITDLQRVDDAITCCDEVIARFREAGEPALREQVARAFVNKGFLLGRVRRGTDAIKVYDQMISQFRNTDDPGLRGLLASALFNKGVVLGQLERNEEAIAVYDEVLSRFGGDASDIGVREQVAKTLLNKGVVLSKLQRSDQEIATYDELIARFGDDAKPAVREQVAMALRYKAMTLDQLQRNEEAIAVYDELFVRFKDAPEIRMREQVARGLINKGLRLSELKRGDEEIATYDEVIARFGGDAASAIREQVATAFYYKGITLGQLQRNEEAIAVYDELFARFKTAAETAVREQVARSLISKGTRLSELKRSDQEIAAYDELIARFRDDAEPILREQVAMALRYKGITLDQLLRSEEAVAVYDELFARFKDAPEIRVREQVARGLIDKGVRLSELKRSDQEIAIYDELIARFGDDAEPAIREQVAMALRYKAMTLDQLQRNEEAIAVYDELSARFKDAPDAGSREQVARGLINKGVRLSELKRSDEEIVTYDELIVRFGDDAEPAIREQVATALLYKGITLGQLGRRDEAAAVYDELASRFGEASEPGIRDLLERALKLREEALPAAT